MRGWCGDGIICTINNERNKSLAASLDVPVVNVSGAFTSAGVPSVVGEDEVVGRVAAEHFTSRGFRNFAFLGPREPHFAQKRSQGFRDAVTEAGFAVHETPQPKIPGGTDWLHQLEHLGEWLRDMDRPVAVFTAFDAVGHMVIQACRHVGLHVPEEVAVLGVDNDPTWCELSNPPLSSISQNFEGRGYMAAELLNRLMAGESPSDEPIGVPAETVVVRRSTDIFATDDETVRAALRFIHEHSDEQLRVNDVAAATHMSRRNIERRFHRALGRTVYDEIRHSRLATARSLLTRTDKPLMEVALDSGFSSASDLSNAFRRHLGMTPSQYRRRHST
ncbi:MAG: substrate-binding domain-containing protein [bacterium]